MLDLETRVQTAQMQLAAARRVAELLPQQLEAARAAEQQAVARYKAGLGTLVEVADAQRLLTQTEIDDSLAKLAVWRSMLQVSTAAGDLAPFLDQVK
jgi:outer membrane protein TolC